MDLAESSNLQELASYTLLGWWDWLGLAGLGWAGHTLEEPENLVALLCATVVLAIQ